MKKIYQLLYVSLALASFVAHAHPAQNMTPKAILHKIVAPTRSKFAHISSISSQKLQIAHTHLKHHYTSYKTTLTKEQVQQLIHTAQFHVKMQAKYNASAYADSIASAIQLAGHNTLITSKIAALTDTLTLFLHLSLTQAPAFYLL